MSDDAASSFILQHFVLTLILKGKFQNRILLSIIVFSLNHSVGLYVCQVCLAFQSDLFSLNFTDITNYVEFCILGFLGSNSM